VQGELAQAFAWNPLFVLLLPYLIFAGLRGALHDVDRQSTDALPHAAWMGYAMVWTMLIYWVARQSSLRAVHVAGRSINLANRSRLR